MLGCDRLYVSGCGGVPLQMCLVLAVLEWRVGYLHGAQLQLFERNDLAQTPGMNYQILPQKMCQAQYLCAALHADAGRRQRQMFV